MKRKQFLRAISRQKGWFSLTGVFLVLLLWTGAGRAGPLYQGIQEGQTIFQQKCASCHTIGSGRLVGPDLQGVTAKRDRTWLQGFIATPDQFIASGDPLALQLLAEYNNLPMPNLALTETQVDQVIAYLESADLGAAPAENALASPAVQNSLLADAVRGQKYFNGELALANGGVNCIACHNVAGTQALGGGALGPDLTEVYTRYGGNTGLGSVLATLPFPSMQSSFANRPLTAEEQADLLAFFEQSAQQPAAGDLNRFTNLFLGVGVIGAMALFGLMAVFWPAQRQSLSDRLRKQA